MALLVLIRHAVTEATGKRLSGRAPGIHLSTLGREQASILAERLADLPLAAVYASPLERCVETAEYVARAREMEVRPLPEVVEVEYGAWTGRSMAQLARTALWKSIQQSPSSIRFPDGERLIDVQTRSVEGLERIAALHKGSAVGVVSHADVIRLVLAHYAGIHIDLFQRLVVRPTSVSMVGVGDRIPRIIGMNDTGALSDARVHPRASDRRRGRGGRAGRFP